MFGIGIEPNDTRLVNVGLAQEQDPELLTYDICGKKFQLKPGMHIKLFDYGWYRNWPDKEPINEFKNDQIGICFGVMFKIFDADSFTKEIRDLLDEIIKKESKQVKAMDMLKKIIDIGGFATSTAASAESKGKRGSSSKGKGTLPLDFADKDLFGSTFYSHHETHTSPTFIRVIGFTSSKKSAYVEYIPGKEIPEMANKDCGGGCTIDSKWLDGHPLPKKPIRKSTANSSTASIADLDGIPPRYSPHLVLSMPGKTYHRLDKEEYSKVFTWSGYS